MTWKTVMRLAYASLCFTAVGIAIFLASMGYAMVDPNANRLLWGIGIPLGVFLGVVACFLAYWPWENYMKEGTDEEDAPLLP